MDGLAGKTVIVTGAARGQGAAEAAALVREGADVIAADVLEDEGHGLAESLTGQPGSVTFRQLDVARPENWHDLTRWLESSDRTLHGLVNNAGIAHRARLPDVTLDGWNRTLAVNLTGAMLGMQACAPLMRSGGSIVNVGSVAALTAYQSVAYTASKWALRGLSRVAALEWGPRGIRTNIIHPGYIETPILADAAPAFLEASLALTPAGRPGTPAEVASPSIAWRSVAQTPAPATLIRTSPGRCGSGSGRSTSSSGRSYSRRIAARTAAHRIAFMM